MFFWKIFHLSKFCEDSVFDRFLSTLRKHYADLKPFLEASSCVADMRASGSSRLENEKIFMVFEKQNFATKFGLEYTMFMKDSVLVIQKQISQTDDYDLILDIPENVPGCHLMSGYIGREVYAAASQYIKSSLEIPVSRKSKYIDIFSVIGYLQLFSNKSQKLLLAKAPQFYSLQVTPQHFSEAAQIRYILIGDTVASYLSGKTNSISTKKEASEFKASI